VNIVFIYVNTLYVTSDHPIHLVIFSIINIFSVVQNMQSSCCQACVISTDLVLIV